MTGCPWEERVEAAVREARLDLEVGRHLEDCADCRALAATIRALRVDAAAAEHHARPRLPDAGTIYAEFRATPARGPLHGSADAAIRAMRAVVLVEVAAAAVAAFVVLGASAWGIRRFGSVTGFDIAALFQFGNGGGSGDIGGTAIVAAGAVILIAALQGVLGLRLDGQGSGGF